MKREKNPMGEAIAKHEWKKHLGKLFLKRKARDKQARKVRKQQKLASV